MRVERRKFLSKSSLDSPLPDRIQSSEIMKVSRKIDSKVLRMTRGPEKLVAKVPMLDIQRGNNSIRSEILAAVTRVIDSGRFLFGPDVEELEQKVAQVCSTRFAISCASGSDALLLSLMALDIGPGDEVIVPSFTFFATASCVARLGAKIVFADIDPETFNISPESLCSKITARTKAIIPVHLFGQVAAMDAIMEIAQPRNLPVIEDAAQAIGSRWMNRPAGSWGMIGCLSFYPTKNLGGMGDGGMLVCDDESLAANLRLLATHGMQPRYHHQRIGINSRLDTIQAAVLNVKMDYLARCTNARREIAARYRERMVAEGLEEFVVLPTESDRAFHVWNQFGVRVRHGFRDGLRRHLAENGVGSEIYYPIPLHRQVCFASLGYREGSLPETERAALEVLHLPIFPELTEEEQETVVFRMRRYFVDGIYRRAA